MSLSTWMICSSVSVILPLACAREAMYCARSPLSRAASRSSVVSRVELHEVLVVELADPVQFLLDQRDFLVLRRLPAPSGRRFPRSTARSARAIAPFVRRLPLARTSNSLVSLAMTACDVGIVGAIEQQPGKCDLVDAPRSASSRAARAHSPSRVLVTIARFALVTVSSSRTTTWPALTTIAIARQHFADHAAGRMLHFLDVGFDHDLIPARSTRPRFPPSRPSRRARRPEQRRSPGR